MELDQAPGYGEIGYWVAGGGARPRRRDARGDAAARLGRAELGLTLIELLDPRGQRALAARRRAHRLPGHRRAAPAPRPDGAGAPDHAVYAWSPA